MVTVVMIVFTSQPEGRSNITISPAYIVIAWLLSSDCLLRAEVRGGKLGLGSYTKVSSDKLTGSIGWEEL